MDNRVLDKIKKLLTLAESDNENEAKLAMERANELLIRHNLSMQDVSRQQSTTITEESVGEEFQFKQPEDKFITAILGKFFFVEILYAIRDTGEKTAAGHKVVLQHLVVVGEKLNVEVAEFVFFYLKVNFRRLWLNYKHESGSNERARQAYYMGLYTGICDKLERKHSAVAQETGLVWVGDAAIKEYLKQYQFRKASGRKHKVYANEQASSAGEKDGRDLEILKGLKEKSAAEQSGKLLK